MPETVISRMFSRDILSETAAEMLSAIPSKLNVDIVTIASVIVFPPYVVVSSKSAADPIAACKGSMCRFGDFYTSLILQKPFRTAAKATANSETPSGC